MIVVTMETLWEIYTLVWVVGPILFFIICGLLLIKVIYDRKKNKEDDYYSKQVRR